MKPTEDLTKEHGPVKLMLKILGKACEQLEAGKEMNVEDMESAIFFIREFADKCHHGKEEKLLFPAMRENSNASGISLIDVLIEEHKKGRIFVKNMAEAVSKRNSKKFAENAKGYVNLLDQHIDKENNVLFPMADKSLSADTQKELKIGFEDIEKNVVGIGRHKELHAIFQKLKEAYL